MSSPSYDWLIVGAGFAGATMARLLAEDGARVLVIDKRDHIGGNAYDYVNEYGVRVHKYGPHIFHTNSDRVFAFLSRFTEWAPYEHRVLASVRGMLVPFPINLETLAKLNGVRAINEETGRALIEDAIKRSWIIGKEVRTAEDQCVSTLGRELYDLFFKGYTTKMWDCEPSQLDKSVTARIPLRFDHDDRYFTDKHQAMPKDGYAAMFERILDHPRIEVRLREHGPGLLAYTAERMIYTGPIDAYYGWRFGPLPYRSLKFTHHHMERDPTDPRAACATVNYPSLEKRSTRATDMGALTDTGTNVTTIVAEEPTGEGEPYYPIPAPENRALYERYAALAAAEGNVTFVGRLARYQYLNMDQVVAQAMMTFERMDSRNPAP